MRSACFDWAVAAYAMPGVAAACLDLQDRHGQNVPLMLWVLWAVDADLVPQVERGARTAAAYEAASGKALRTARRALARALPEVDDDEREAFRSRVKAVELDGEQMLMAALERLAKSGPARPPGELLARAAAAYGAPLEAETFAPLLARL